MTIASNVTGKEIDNLGGTQKWIQSTLAYKTLEAHSNNIFFYPELEKSLKPNRLDPDATAIVDVISGYQRKNFKPNKKRPRLALIMQEALYNGINIITTDISQLGDTVEEIQAFYSECKANNVSITIYDSTKKNNINQYSTAYVGGGILEEDLLSEVYKRIDNLKPEQISNLQGKNSKEIPSTFFDAYFLYEAYMIPEDVAFMLSGLSVNTFHSKAVQLETAYRNIFVEYQFPDEEPQLYIFPDLQKKWYKYYNIEIAKLPKRYGNIPERFSELQDIVYQMEISDPIEKEYRLIDACKELDMPVITLIDYYRYVGKSTMTSRKELFALYKEHYNTALIDAFMTYKANVDILPISPSDKKEQYTYFHLKDYI